MKRERREEGGGLFPYKREKGRHIHREVYTTYTKGGIYTGRYTPPRVLGGINREVYHLGSWEALIGRYTPPRVYQRGEVYTT